MIVVYRLVYAALCNNCNTQRFAAVPYGIENTIVKQADGKRN